MDRARIYAQARPLQVAAVCYRRDGASVKFLLVRTTTGRWTFPKGRMQDGLLPAQVAALEAFEEGGVEGQVDPRPIWEYLHRKESLRKYKSHEMIVLAFLLKVEKSSLPAESHRTPQWFTPGEAKLRLRQRRSARYFLSIRRVVDSALLEITRKQSQCEC